MPIHPPAPPSIQISRAAVGLVCFFSLFLLPSAHADGAQIKWRPTTLKDPLTSQRLPAYEIIGAGASFDAESARFDMVGAEMTDEKILCFNPETGYIAFRDDFEQLPKDQVMPLVEWLHSNYSSARAPRTALEKFVWAEKVYAQRRMDVGFWSRFYRLMAYLYRNDSSQHLGYVRKALPLLEKELAQDADPFHRMSALFLLGEYHRRLGDAARSNAYLEELVRFTYVDGNGKKQGCHPHFLVLVEVLRKVPDSQLPYSTNARPSNQ